MLKFERRKTCFVKRIECLLWNIWKYFIINMKGYNSSSKYLYWLPLLTKKKGNWTATISLTMLKIMQFFHLAIPFWWGMFVIVSCFWMLSFWQKILKAKNKYSLPWLIWSTLITKLVWLFIWFFNILNLSNVHALFHRK